jgi:membrane-associated phospholipid phosphatase
MSPAPSREWAAIRLAMLSMSGIGLLYVLAVHTRAGQLWDTWAMLAVADVLAGAAWAEALLELVSPSTVLMAGFALAAFAGALRGVGAAVTALATIAGTAATAVALKALLTRPQLLDDAGNSLPSGHVAAVAGLAAAAALVCSAERRGLVTTVGSAAVGLTGLATLALQWHRPSDVVASALLAVGVAAVIRTAIGTLLDGYPQAPNTQVTHR